MQKCGADTGDMEKTGKSVDYPTLFIRDPTPDLNLSREIFKGKYPSYIIPHMGQYEGRVQWGIRVRENI